MKVYSFPLMNHWTPGVKIQLNPPPLTQPHHQVVKGLSLPDIIVAIHLKSIGPLDMLGKKLFSLAKILGIPSTFKSLV